MYNIIYLLIYIILFNSQLSQNIKYGKQFKTNTEALSIHGWPTIQLSNVFHYTDL